MSRERRCPKCNGHIEPLTCENGHPVADQPPRLEGFAELVAQKVKEKLAEEFRVAEATTEARHDPDSLVTAKELARRVGMSARWVYDHSGELGVVRTGSGKRPRLRFDPARALALLAERDGETPSWSRRRSTDASCREVRPCCR
jgi:hypothetical protein